MKWTVLIAGAILVPAPCLAGCDIRVPDASIRTISAELRERAKNVLTIAIGYRKSDTTETMWLSQLSADIRVVSTELAHLRDLIHIRDAVSGTENQRLVNNVLRMALSGASELALATKEHLLQSTSQSVNSAVTSEISRTVPALEKIVHLGDTCESNQ